MASPNSLQPARRIGLTGGIGSGKSTVAAMLQALGAAVIDTDAIARQLTLPGGLAIEAIRAEFGSAFIAADGAMDRDRMRALAFTDDGAKRRLEAILHPLIGQETLRQSEASQAAVKVFDVPLLAESGRWRTQVDQVWVVDCPESLQIERVMQRSGWSAEAVQAVIARQAPRAARLAIADLVIVNQGLSLDVLRSEVALAWASLGQDTATASSAPPAAPAAAT